MKRILILFMAVAAYSSVRAQLLSLHTDLLLDGLMVPNLGLEIITGNKTSLDATVFAANKPWNKEVRLVGLAPEFRYWIGGRPLTRPYVGIGLMGATYDITWSGERFKGDAYAAGLTLGYAWLLGSHWSVIAHSGIGLMYYDQQRYYLGDRINSDWYNDNGLFLFPYHLGVTIAWIIK